MKKLYPVFAFAITILFMQNISNAQQNLISNGDFSSGNSGFLSMYSYCNTADCIGSCGCATQYAVGANPTFYHGLFTGQDHTTGSGNFLIADGATSPGVYVWRQTIAVTQNTDYIFSYWLCSVYPSSPASIQLYINGSVIFPPFNAPGTVNTWINTTVPWNSGVNTSVTIELVDINTTFVGNDFGLDDISLKQNCFSSNPFICSVIPNLNSINVNKSSDINVTFTQGMNASSINSSNIKVFGYQTGLKNISVSYNAGTWTATINPTNDFKVGEKVQVSLSSGIQTSSNTPITPFTWTFIVQAIEGAGEFYESGIIDSVNLNTTQPSVDVKSGDIDGDGDIDLMTLGYFTGINIYKNDGTGKFTLFQQINSLPGVEHYEGFFPGDYDNDGDLDIALTIATFSYFVDSIYTYKNDGNGFFTKSSSSPGGGLIGGSADLDEDGDLDIGASWGLDKLRYFINDGNGNFITRLIENLGYYHTNGLDLGDLDNDGDIDLIVSIKDFDDTHCKFLSLLNNGNAGFTLNNPYFTNEYFDYIQLSDINGDRNLDVVGRNYHYFSIGNDLFNQTAFNDSGAIAFPFDFDGDGDIDLSYSNNPSGNVKFYNNNGTGNFNNISNTTAGLLTNSGTSGDFDNDGDIDLAVNNIQGHFGRPDISILKNGTCITPQCPISGASTITVGSTSNLYVESCDQGFWEISNYDNSEASITSERDNDSIYVSAGNVLGHFVLYYVDENSCGFILYAKHVYVDNPLPVELASFSSIVNARNVTLNWLTASEENNSGFDIERLDESSTDPERWNKIGFVKGHGTVSAQQSYSFEDRNLSTGKYKYRLKQTDYNGNFEYHELQNEVIIGTPDIYYLSQNYPNPFNPNTHLEFGIPVTGFVSLKVYNSAGKEVAALINEIKSAGYYTVNFNGGNLPSGVYYYRLESDKFTQVRKMVLIK